jgi:hypothetical protein
VRSRGSTPCSASCSIMICSSLVVRRIHQTIEKGQLPAGSISICAYSLTIIF